MKENKKTKRVKPPNEKKYVGFDVTVYGNRKSYKLKYE